MNKTVPAILSLFLALTLPGSRSQGADASAGAGAIAGIVLYPDGRPLAGGKMVFFREGSGPPPCPSRFFRPPEEVAGIGDGGTFEALLPEGRYYISAVKKRTDDLVGPPEEGDYVYPSPADLQGGQKIYVVKKGERTDIGTAKAVPFERSSLALRDDVTAIEGTIRGPDGRPVPGAVAFAFPTKNLVGRPLFVSERTGSDGRYLLRVGEGGTYYVKIRTSRKGGHPEDGELIGFHGKDRPAPVALKTGEVVKGIDVQGRSFASDGKGPLGKGARP